MTNLEVMFLESSINIKNFRKIKFKETKDNY